MAWARVRAAELRERLVRVACTYSTEAPGRGVGEVAVSRKLKPTPKHKHTPKLSLSLSLCLSLSLSLSLSVALGVAGGEPKLSQTLSQS